MKSAQARFLSLALLAGCGTGGDAVGKFAQRPDASPSTGGSGGSGDSGASGGDIAPSTDASVGGAAPDAALGADAGGASADAGTPAPDADPAADAHVPTPDVYVPTPDMYVPTPDMYVPTPDMFVPTPDMYVPTPDMYVPTPDMFVPTPDMFVPTPDAALPDAALPDAALPDAALPDAALPDAALPDVALPDAALPDVAVPDAEIDAVLPPPPPRIGLNEIECHDREYIELVSAEAVDVDLSAWFVTDDPADPTSYYRIPAGTTLAAGGRLTLYAQTRREDGFTFGISCGNDAVYLFQPDGTLLDDVLVGDHAAATTWGRLPDGLDGEFAANAPTPDAANTPPVLAGGDLFDPFRLPIIDLTVNPAGMDSWVNVDPRASVPGQFQMTTDGVPGDVLQVGVHLKGRIGSLRLPPAKSAFKVDLNFVVPGQRLLGLKELTLNNMVQDSSMIHEFTAYSIFRAAGLAAPRVGYAWVRLNGADYGLYAQMETYDDVFLDAHFPTTQHLYEGAYGQDLTAAQLAGLDIDEGDDQSRADLATIIAALDAVPIEAGYAATQDLIDWYQVLGVMAAEIYIGHWDGYGPTRNNWFMHTNEFGRLSLMPWGTDQTFARVMPLHDGQGRLLRTCMASAECRLAYDLRVQDLVTVIDTLDLPTQIRALATALQPAVAADPKRTYTPATVAAQVQATIDFLARRRAEIGTQLACLLGPNADPDGDGFRCDGDCAPNDPTVHPGSPEICGDGIDQDCTGRADDAFECPDCVERFHGTHRYLICPTPRNWEQASTHCAESGSGPLHVDSGDENAWLWGQARALAAQNWWLGLTDLAQEGRFEWADGVAPTFTAWAGGEPNNAGNNEDCGHFWSDRAQWNDIPCTQSMGVLCEDPCAPGEDRDGDGALRCGNDCNDDDPNVKPGLPEICGDRLDQNCDGTADEGAGCDCVEINNAGRRYTFCDRPRNFADSRAECQRQGMDLVVINDGTENQWVFDTAMSRNHRQAWLGLSDTAAEGQFVWVNAAPLNFTRWSGGQPDNGGNNEDCGSFFADRAGVWNDLDCAATATTICEQR